MLKDRDSIEVPHPFTADCDKCGSCESAKEKEEKLEYCKIAQAAYREGVVFARTEQEEIDIMNQRCVFCKKTINFGVRYDIVVALNKIESCKRSKRAKVIEYKSAVICEECVRDGLNIEVNSIEGFFKFEIAK
jgi:hypothetical protein